MEPLKDAELAVIGALIQDERAYAYTSPLTAKDFTVPELRAVFDKLNELHNIGKKTDMITLCSELPGLETVLMDSMRYYTTTVLTPSHVDIIREASTRRKASELAINLHRNMGDNSVDMMAYLSDFNRKISELGAVKSDWETCSDVFQSTLKWVEQQAKGKIVPYSGINNLDDLTGGFFPGELTIIGARPGTGKTVLGMLVALNAAKQGLRVGMLNLEMLDTQYGQRLISHISGVDGMKLRKGKLEDTDWPLILQAASELSKLPIAFQFTTRYIEDLVAELQNQKLDVLIVDYIQLLRTRQKIESERLIIGHISWQLKKLAVDKRIPVIALAQLRRPATGMDGKMPTMSDLRESGNLEADADGIILMHQPLSSSDPYVHKLDKTGFENWKEQGLRYICLKVEKQRNGRLGIAPVLFDPPKMRYLGIERGNK